MSWVTIVLLAAAASSDSFIIGFNYGVRGVRIGSISNLFLSLVCFLGTLASMLAGQMIGLFFDPSLGQLIGGVLFALLGAWMLRGALKPREPGRSESCSTMRCYSENPEIVDKDNSKIIELRESFWIGVLLCVNNIGIGIGGGMTGSPIVSTPLACAAMSFLFIKAGCLLGGRIENERLSRTLEFASAGIILLLGAGNLFSLLI